MAASVNKVTLLGYIGKDPEMRYTPAGKAVCTTSLATTSYSKAGEPPKTEWHNLVFFDKLAEVVGKYVRKGSQLYVEGTIKSDKWTDKDNVVRTTYKIICNSVQFISNSKKSENKNISDNNQEDIPF